MHGVVMTQSMGLSIELSSRIPRGAPRAPGEAGEASESHESGRLSDLLACMGFAPGADPTAASIPVPMRPLRAGDALFHEGAVAEALYFVNSGSFKTFRTAEDGYEQVLGFIGRGEVLGFEAIWGGSHPTGAMALETSSVFAVLLRDMVTVGHRVPEFERMLQNAASRALSARCDLAGMMAAVAAEVRLARFLLHLSKRMAALAQSPRRFRLRMNRRDIASYLGVAHETVSRAFGTLAGLGLVRVAHREIEILNSQQLERFARHTRRPPDDGWPAAVGGRGRGAALETRLN